jgi:hypothetical protein
LTAGTYDVGALYASGADALIFPGFATNFATNPAITFVKSGFVFGGTLANPTSTAGVDPAYFGPNFTFVEEVGASAVPLPSVAWGGLVILGAVGLKKSQRRQRQPQF